MGVRHKRQQTVWTERMMQDYLRSFRSNPRYRLENLFVFGWESDLLFLTRSGYWTEVEIKVSRADFLADVRNKKDKHACLSDDGFRRKPNYFFYAVPEGLVRPEEVPLYAGLVWVDRWASVVKKAPLLHKDKIDPNSLDLADKFYFNMVAAKNDAVQARAAVESVASPYREGLMDGFNAAQRLAMELLAETCPHREPLADGRTHCRQTGAARYNPCSHRPCERLDAAVDRFEKLLSALKTGSGKI